MRAKIYAAVEGKTDKVVVERLIAHVGAEPGTVYVAEGKPNLKKRIAGYNQAAQHSLWLVLVDLDRDGCAPSLRAVWLPEPSSGLCFRVAVHAVEAWLMADAETLAGFLGVARSNIPANPEAVSVRKRRWSNWRGNHVTGTSVKTWLHNRGADGGWARLIRRASSSMQASTGVPARPRSRLQAWSALSAACAGWRRARCRLCPEPSAGGGGGRALRLR